MFKELLEQIEKCESEIDYEKHKDNYLNVLVHSYPTLTADEEKDLFTEYKKTHDSTYRDIIYKCHMKDVHDACTDTTGYRDDLISEGMVFLCEFIDKYDYTMPYMTFAQALKTRLTVLYNSKRIENHEQLNTAMSIEELKEQEEEGKCLTDTDEIKPMRRKRYREQLVIEIAEGVEIVPNNYLIIVPKEELTIVERDQNYLLNRKEKTELFKKIFSEKPDIKNSNKKLGLRLTRKYKPSDMDY